MVLHWKSWSSSVIEWWFPASRKQPALRTTRTHVACLQVAHLRFLNGNCYFPRGIQVHPSAASINPFLTKLHVLVLRQCVLLVLDTSKSGQVGNSEAPYLMLHPTSTKMGQHSSWNCSFAYADNITPCFHREWIPSTLHSPHITGATQNCAGRDDLVVAGRRFCSTSRPGAAQCLSKASLQEQHERAGWECWGHSACWSWQSCVSWEHCTTWGGCAAQPGGHPGHLIAVVAATTYCHPTAADLHHEKMSIIAQ